MAQHYDWGPHDDGQRWVIASTTDSAAVHNSSTANRGCTLQTTASNHLTMAKDTKIARRANPTANALTTTARTSPTDGQLGGAARCRQCPPLARPWPMTPNSTGAPTSPPTRSDHNVQLALGQQGPSVADNIQRLLARGRGRQSRQAR